MIDESKKLKVDNLKLEYRNLEVRILILRDKIFSDDVRNSTDETEKALLMMQYHAMSTYHGILALRLDRAEKGAKNERLNQ